MTNQQVPDPFPGTNPLPSELEQGILDVITAITVNNERLDPHTAALIAQTQALLLINRTLESIDLTLGERGSGPSHA